ncbi:protease HtpX [Candidatus Rariloculus sp.]|uniref:protease HtpX n=1 Tax=Candidatus Rariloculus sp. TaxID=3101265 RepID=UPI003D119AB0
MSRILMLVATNVAVLIVLTIVMRLLGLESILNAEGTQLDLQSLLIFSAVIGFAGSFISLALSKWMAKRSTGAKVIESPRNELERWVLSTVQRQARTAGIGCPQVAIYESPDVNAFATGASRNNALVAVSTGLLRSMDRDSVEAVLGHEVSHVANGDMITLTLIQGVVNTFVIFLSRIIGFLVDRLLFKTQRGYGPGFFIASIVAQIILGVLASTIVMWFSRQREFRADAGGAQLAGRRKMISALRSLQRMHEPNDLPDSIAAFGISGRKRGGIRRLFASHPPLSERIEALERGR